MNDTTNPELVTAYQLRRPVYVLGAGFSRAIHDEMPLTDALGDAVTSKLGVAWPTGPDAATFEDRLTLLSTPLPFLQGHENTARRALAERVTSALASELDDRTAAASAGSPPLWLLQLVSLWHAERAVVITFNYDTLVEQAVTSLRPALPNDDEREPSGIHGFQVVFPAPSAVNALTFESLDAPLPDSFQLLKLHGSLNWYWALGDGATVVRDANVYGFGPRPGYATRDVAGVRLLDRFLIPPVTSKDSYYNVNLVHMLWRSAYEAIRQASRLTVIGYSMPPGDRIAAEMLRGVPEGTPVDLVNRDVGSQSDPTSPAGRIRSLGLTLNRSWEGTEAVRTFVADSLDRASALLPSNEVWDARKGASVVASIPPQRIGQKPVTVTLRALPDGQISTGGFDWAEAGRSSMPPTESSLQNFPRGHASLDQFFTAEKLAAAVSDGQPFVFEQNGQRFRGVGAVRAAIGRWAAVLLMTAPE